MPKRGETRPYRMAFAWPPPAGSDRPVTGTRTFRTLQDAENAARHQAAHTGPTGDRCTVVVTHRAQPDVVLYRFDPPTD